MHVNAQLQTSFPNLPKRCVRPDVLLYYFYCNVTSYHKPSSLKQQPLFSSKFFRSEVPAWLLCAQGFIRPKSRCLPGKTLGEEPTSKLIQVVGQVQFLLAMDLRSCFWAGGWGCSLFLEAAWLPSHVAPLYLSSNIRIAWPSHALSLSDLLHQLEKNCACKGFVIRRPWIVFLLPHNTTNHRSEIIPTLTLKGEGIIQRQGAWRHS